LRTGYDLRTARRSLNLLTIEWANRGINLWTIEAGFYSINKRNGNIQHTHYTIDLLDHVIRTGTGTNQTDITCSRISVETYLTIPNKNFQGRPIQVWFNEQSGATYPDGAGTVVESPTITVLPVPNVDNTYTFVYWRMRRIQDAGDGGTRTQDIPFRFLPCMVAGLAYYLSMKLPDATPRIQMLKADYEEQFRLAAEEDRERASNT